jgi:uncharacterized membrane protein YcaP (DUF421 family)
MYRIPGFGRVMQGEPMMLIYQGHVNDNNLKKARITTDELLEAVREHGVASIKEVNLAVLESDGNISVLSADYQHRTRRNVHTAGRKAKKQEKSA